jgi:hypothetical protein
MFFARSSEVADDEKKLSRTLFDVKVAEVKSSEG